MSRTRRVSLTPSMQNVQLPALLISHAIRPWAFSCSRIIAVFLAAITVISSAEAKFTWEKVAPADLAAVSSASAPGSDLEILFSRHRMDSDSSSTYVAHHIQAKIYTKKGVERTSLFSIEYEKKQKIWNTMARVVKPDGSSVELTKADYHENTVLKTGGYEIQRTTFAFPNVQPGDVLEYRWNAEISGDYGYYKQYCQAEDVATREFSLDVVSARQDFTVGWYNCEGVEFKPKTHKVVIRNLPPFVPEPLMPADTEFRGWVVILFSSPYERLYTNEDAWQSIGDYIGENFRLETVPNAAIRAKAAELTANTTAPDEKLAKLYVFTQTEISNLDFFESARLADAKKKRRDEEEYQSAAKTMERRSGTIGDINRFFASLARASGFEVRYAMSANRNEVLNIKRPKGWVFADRQTVAVKIGETWKFYAPGNHLVPAGLLDERDEGAMAFVCDEKKSWFDVMQSAPPTDSALKRTGRFTLDDEGSLDGNVVLTMTGHRAIPARDTWWDQSDEQVTKSVRENVAERLPTAEVTTVTIENGHDVSQPLIARYHVHVPGYADSIGSRLGLPLNFFEANAAITFTNETRRYPIYFDYAEKKSDDIQITIPEAFVLDGASAPASVGKPDDFITARYGVKFMPKTRTISYVREQVVGNGGSIHFRAESYPALRTYFDRIHRSDAHQLVLKPKAAVEPSSPAAPADKS
jgi:hypothetical protein